jgi:hypothetical protein
MRRQGTVLSHKKGEVDDVDGEYVVEKSWALKKIIISG